MASISPVAGMMQSVDTLTRRGLITLAALVAVILAVVGVRAVTAAPTTDITLLTREIAPGVAPGTKIEMNGLRVGQVTEITEERSGNIGVHLSFTNAAKGLITDTMQVAFAPGNDFGVTTVSITPGKAGMKLTSGAVFRPSSAPDDATMATLVKSLSTIDSQALKPHMSQLLAQVDLASKSLLPMINALGSVAEVNAQTQTVPTAESLPVIANVFAGTDQSIGEILEGLHRIWSWTAPEIPGYPAKQTGTLNALSDGLVISLNKLLSPTNSAALATLLTPVQEMSVKLVQAMPNAATNGQQLAELIERIRRSMPDNGSGPVLNVDVALAPASGSNR